MGVAQSVNSAVDPSVNWAEEQTRAVAAIVASSLPEIQAGVALALRPKILDSLPQIADKSLSESLSQIRLLRDRS